MKIIDCFIFYNEVDILEYRLNTLNEVVDYFIIVEARQTFVGKEKPLFYKHNEFSYKIVHVVVDMPHIPANIDNREQWHNELFQRNAISDGIKQLSLQNEDVIIVSDADEIPNAQILVDIKNGNLQVDINTLEMDMYYYNLTTKINILWNYCKIMTFHKYTELNYTIDQLRNTPCNIIEKGGWHLSYFGDKSFIQNKIKNFSHQEYNNSAYTELSVIDDRIKNGKDLFCRGNTCTIELNNNSNLPQDYSKYLQKYFITRPYRKQICSVGQHSPEYLSKYVIDTIQINSIPTDTFIDVGCGVGFHSNLLKKVFQSRFIGVDFSDATIRYHKKLDVPIYDEIYHCSSAKLPDIHGTISLCMENLEHLYYEDVVEAINELKRVGDYVIITIPTPETVINKWWLENEIIEASLDTIPLTEYEYNCLESCVHKSCIKIDSLFKAGFKTVYPHYDESRCYYSKSDELDVEKLEIYGIRKQMIADIKNYKLKYITLLEKSYTLEPIDQ